MNDFAPGRRSVLVLFPGQPTSKVYDWPPVIEVGGLNREPNTPKWTLAGELPPDFYKPPE
jgi:hypothetical protein